MMHFNRSTLLLGAIVSLLGLLFGCSDRRKSEEHPTPVPVPTTKDGRHFLADKPLKLIPKKQQQALQIKEDIEAAEERASSYKYTYGNPSIAMQTMPNAPTGKGITIEKATEGIEGKGPLKAVIDTSMGTITCTLMEKEAAKGVAHFVSLARGINKWLNGRVKTWSTKPFYTKTTVYRVQVGEVIHAGFPPQAGESKMISPAVVPTFTDKGPLKVEPYTLSILKVHDLQPLSTNFIITASENPRLENLHHPIGKCEPYNVIQKIAGQAVTPKGIPLEEVVIKTVKIER
ncbi:MAG: hypothetical protein GY854_00905 [Deltaproteobacteria bacterium]|nr:hypothetical protein [Deltaproteobacteria bacterium]